MIETLEQGAPRPLPPRSQPLPEPTLAEKLRERLTGPLFTVINLSIFLLLWEIIQSSGISPVRREWVPTPSEIAAALWQLIATGRIWSHLAFSTTNYVVGVGIAIVLGVPLGMILGANSNLKAIGGAWVWALYSTPIVAIQPILVIAFGFNAGAKIFLIALISIFAVVVTTMDGIATLDQSLIKAGRVFGASQMQLFRKVIAPYMLPWLINGMRYAAVRGLIGLLISELYGSFLGLGTIIIRAAEIQDTPTAYASIAVIVMLSVSAVSFFTFLERKLSPWRKQVAL